MCNRVFYHLQNSHPWSATGELNLEVESTWILSSVTSTSARVRVLLLLANVRIVYFTRGLRNVEYNHCQSINVRVFQCTLCRKAVFDFFFFFFVSFSFCVPVLLRGNLTSACVWPTVWWTDMCPRVFSSARLRPEIKSFRSLCLVTLVGVWHLQP